MSEPICIENALSVVNLRGRNLQGAGLLCWSVCPATNEVYFLLGKESDHRSRNNHRKMKGWCDFGGGCKRGNDANGESAAETAAREFLEETCHMVRLSDTPDPPSHKSVLSMLQRGDVDYAIVTKAHKSKRRYVCFVRKTPWDPSIPIKFTNMRTLLSRIYQDASYVHQLNKQLPHVVPYYRPGMVVGDSVVRAVRDACYNNSGTLKVLLETDTAAEWHEFDTRGAKFVSRYVAWVKARQQLIDNYLALPLEIRHHPSIRVLHKYGTIFGVAVNPDYLEKSEIAWWSLTTLQRELDARFCPFRPCFRNVVKFAITKFSKENCI